MLTRGKRLGDFISVSGTGHRGQAQNLHPKSAPKLISEPGGANSCQQSSES